MESSVPLWETSGMGTPSGCLTLSTSESPNDAVVSSLSGILEPPGPLLQKYCLSPTACQGILRRAERRGRTLPPMLKIALEQMAALKGSEQTPPSPEPSEEDPELEDGATTWTGPGLLS